MSEIVVGDVLAWLPELSWTGDEAELLRPLSWAVTIHATIPALPPLRGGELIVIPPRALAQLQRVEMAGWREIAGLLAIQPIAGLIVDRAFEGAPIAGVPFLRASTEFLDEAEQSLNRIITEHRAEIYRLGSDLSRAFSTASIGGADLDALVKVAGDIGKLEMVLFDRSGRVLARSRNGPRRMPFNARLADRSNGQVVPVYSGNARWWVHPLRHAGDDQLFLAAGPSASGMPETARLVLTQASTAMEAFLGPLGRRRTAEVPVSRESLLAELMLGKVASDLIAARAELLGLDPEQPLRVVLFVSDEPGFDGRIRTQLSREVRDRVAMLSPRELAVLIPDSGWSDWWSDLQLIERGADGVTLVRSEHQPGITGIVRATRQARMLGRVGLGSEADEQRVFELLLPLWDPAVFEPGSGRLESFADGLLGPLEEHDVERGSELVVTLEGYLAAGGSVTGAAERLDVHRNTLGYRLKRIGELTGADIDDAGTRLAFGLAIRIRQLQGLLG